MSTIRVLEATEMDNGGHIVSVEWATPPGLLGRLLGRRGQTTVHQYYTGAGGLVWRTFPGLERCDLFLESDLKDAWDKYRLLDALVPTTEQP